MNRRRSRATFAEAVAAGIPVRRYRKNLASARCSKQGNSRPARRPFSVLSEEEKRGRMDHG